jgi:hypothetical protein
MSNQPPWALTDEDMKEIPSLLGRSDSQKKAYETAMVYMNRYAVTEKLYPKLINMTKEHVEGDCMEEYLEDFALWLAREQIVTRQKTFLSTDSKAISFGLVKELLRLKFKEHDLWKRDESSWWTKMRSDFKREAERARMNDDGIAEERKSEPLYRDVSSSGIIRAKYTGLEAVDSRTVAKAILHRGDAQALLEFNIYRSAVGRGGEHRALRWDGGNWDWFFNAADIDWRIDKQVGRQCMLFFHDAALYMLDVYMSFALFFLFGGLHRPPTIPLARHPFVFPSLHNVKKESVAERMTNLIRSTISDKTRKKAFTSRSSRKGTSTELAAHGDVSTDERYCRGGWGATHSSSNADGYIEFSPVLNAPGGKALAGWDDCHAHIYPPRLECLGSSVPDDVIPRLLDELFTNDIEQLKPGGKLRPLLPAALASLIRHYKSLVQELGSDNKIVKKIHEVMKRANIEDHDVPTDTKGPRYLFILRHWSEKISADFYEQNTKQVQSDAPLEQQVQALATGLHLLTNEFKSFRQESSQRDDNLMQTIDILSKENSTLTKENAWLKQRLGESPPRRRRRVAVTETAETAATETPVTAATETPDIDVAERPNSTESFGSAAAVNKTGVAITAPPPAKKPKASVDLMLDASSAPSDKLGGIRVSHALTALYEAGKFKELQQKAAKDECKKVPFSCLFDPASRYFLPVHQNFSMGSEENKYKDGMKIVALSITDDQWEKILKGDMMRKERDDMFACIDKSAKLKTRELEIECGLHDPKKTTNRIIPTMSTLGLRFQAIKRHFAETKQKTPEQTEDWVLNKLGEQAKYRQVSVKECFGLKPKSK